MSTSSRSQHSSNSHCNSSNHSNSLLENNRFIAFVRQWQADKVNPLDPDCNEKLQLFYTLHDFHFYRYHYEAHRFHGRVFLPTLMQLWRVCRFFSEQQIVEMNNTDLWRKIHCVYGRKLRNFICYKRNWEVPKMLPKKRIPERTERGEFVSFVTKPSTTNQLQLVEALVNMLNQPYREPVLHWLGNHIEEGNDFYLRFTIVDEPKLTKVWAKVKGNRGEVVKDFDRMLRKHIETYKYFTRAVVEDNQQRNSLTRIYVFDQHFANEYLKWPTPQQVVDLEHSFLNGPYFIGHQTHLSLPRRNSL